MRPSPHTCSSHEHGRGGALLHREVSPPHREVTQPSGMGSLTSGLGRSPESITMTKKQEGSSSRARHGAVDAAVALA